MKSFINNNKLQRMAIRLKEVLSPEDSNKLKSLDTSIEQKKIKEIAPDYNSKEAIPSSFAISEQNVEQDAPKILKALIKYRAVRTSMNGFEFEIRKDSSWALYDKLIKANNIDPIAYNKKNSQETIPISTDGVKALLYRQLDFIAALSQRKAKAKYLLKQTLSANVKDDRLKLGFTENVGTRTVRQSLNVAAQALRELKAKFKLGRFADMDSAFDTAIHALSMGKSMASVDFEENPVRKPRVKTTSPIEQGVKNNSLPLV